MGSWLARRWLGAASVSNAECELLLRLPDNAAAVVCALANCTALWAAAAVMGGTGLDEARSAFWAMLSTTDQGHLGCIAITAAAFILIIRALPGLGDSREWLVFAGLAVFTVARASMGHAGEDGFWTLALAAEVLHLGAIGAWFGIVVVSAWRALQAPRLLLDFRKTSYYLDRMSRSAMVAVVVIVFTGLFNAWQRIGAPRNVLHNPYGTAFLVKVGLVGIALVLGGYNKYVGLPGVQLKNGGTASVKLVLQCETVILFGALIVAAIMTSLQPPASV